MANRNNHDNRFITGTLLGGILGGAAGLLMAPKSGKELREDLIDSYDKLTETTRDFTEQLKHPFSYEEPSNKMSSLLAGGATGVVLGSIIALLLAPQSGKKLRASLSDKSNELMHNLNSTSRHAMNSAEDIKDSIVDAINKISHRKGKSRMGDIMHWADLGMRLVNQLQKRR